MTRRPQYGIDGFPHLVGFGSLAAALGAAAPTVLRAHRPARIAALVGAAAAAVPTTL